MKKGFTLMELIIIVVIIGILAMIALPQFFKVAERGRAAEGVATLDALRNAQLRRATERGTTTAVMDDLDIEDSSVLLKFFNAPVLVGGIDIQNTPDAVIATVQRNATQNEAGNNYTLGIRADGIFTCAGGAADTCQMVRPKEAD